LWLGKDLALLNFAYSYAYSNVNIVPMFVVFAADCSRQTESDSDRQGVWQADANRQVV